VKTPFSGQLGSENEIKRLLSNKMNHTSTYRPYWFDKALRLEGEPIATPLSEDIDTDVCIVGGGYTGLWTALMLKEAQPEGKIVVIEQQRCGYGASGSNGGCLLTLATKYLTLKKMYGETEAKRLVKASEDAVSAIAAFCRKHRIDCDLRLDGALYMATNPSQVGCMDSVLHALEGAHLNSWAKLNLEQAKVFAGTQDLHEGMYSKAAGSVQPARLVRGLARVAREMGVVIHEDTPMDSLDEGCAKPKIKTPRGTITAQKVVLATNAWMATQFKQFSRTIAVVSSDMAITEPCPDLLAKIGLSHGATVCDSRIFVHYYHTTSDGRLLFGKGGNTFAYNSQMIPSFFLPSAYRGQLQGAINRFFPEFENVKLQACWNGGSDRSVTGFPFFDRLNGNPNIFYGLGYSGNGVTQAYLGGKILSALVRGVDDVWSRCGFIGGPRGQFPVEPIKWLGSVMVRNAIRKKEADEDAGKIPSLYSTFMARFAKAAGKADK
jgi:putative aminophosphonate oxidoreductase